MTILRAAVVSLLLLLLLTVGFAVPARADDARGRQLLNALGCKGCHSFEGRGGSIGPALDSIGKRLTAAAIETQLLHPKKNNPNSMMPGYGYLPPADLAAVAAFLAGRK
ncbi:hypothetical protein C2E25_16350 [Geothermobacter hydrogeniphilus]|uniref:Cytochrome c domain-containing protein n=1 Tax=Geothermobacter hydrogeniphilus TaxID=1969733 RepID=A0A2K2H5Z9_9BACT|nr:c-type cytochrome [Geothermobacter hydrogeniphilus]PNU18681.1 hypothetical protein C2E25_16350 [Geothermobacter hydrogeniphilus]